MQMHALESYEGVTDIMKPIAECLFCGSTKQEFRFQASDRWHEVEGRFNVHQCSDCGLLFLNPQPSGEEIAAHYPTTYYSLQSTVPDQARDQRLYEIFYGRNSNPLRKALYLPYKPVLRTLVGDSGQSILDVGCGAGHFLATAKKIRGMKAFGVEPYAFNRTFADENDLDIFSGSLESAGYPDNCFDVITLNHVFEHVSNPRSTLQELKRILKPGGTLIIGVPQSECFLYRVFGRCWKQLDVPRHLFVPSSTNLKAIAEATGYKVKKLRYNSMPSSIMGTLFYWQNDRGKRKRYLHQFKEGKLLFFALLPFSYFCNLLRIGDQVEISLTKE
jgi:SAM-dependent methyltransferase